MAQIIPFDDLAASLERDRKAFRLRLAGLSVRRISEELDCTTDQVDASLSRMLGGITPELRTRTIQLELERYDEFQRALYAKAAGGDCEAINTSLKISEARRKLLGLEPPPRSEDLLVRALTAAQESTSDRIQRALDRIAGKAIDGEVVQPKQTEGRE